MFKLSSAKLLDARKLCLTQQKYGLFLDIDLDTVPKDAILIENEREHYRRLPCNDCDVDTRAIKEYYAVNDTVWRQAVSDKDLVWKLLKYDGFHNLSISDGFLCIGCLEQRLGRRLISADFKAVPINCTEIVSARLRDRLLSK